MPRTRTSVDAAQKRRRAASSLAAVALAVGGARQRGGVPNRLAIFVVLASLAGCQAGPPSTSQPIGTTASPSTSGPIATSAVPATTSGAPGEPSSIPSAGATGGATAISVGLGHACALMSTGGVKCWGENVWGQLGYGKELLPSTTPVDVVGLGDRAIAIAAGEYHTCAILSAGNVKCWGYNAQGQLGNGVDDTGAIKRNHINAPVDVIGLPDKATAIATGGSQTCVVLAAGDVACWGDVPGNGLDNSSTPVRLKGLASRILAVGSGDGDACIVLGGGSMKCWGNNAYGQLGNGTSDNDAHNYVTDVAGIADGVAGATAVSLGSAYACALTTEGGVLCWGQNIYGQLGIGTVDKPFSPLPHTVPHEVAGLQDGIIAIDAGQTSTCALTKAGRVDCWGTATGDAAKILSSIPLEVTALTDRATAISVGSFACALMSGGQVECWGTRGNGLLGNGTTDESAVPVEVLLSGTVP